MLALYRLFKGVNQNLAALMVILGGLTVSPIYFANTLNDVAALLFVRGAAFSYLYENGRAVRSKAELARLKALAVPPAYVDVRYAQDRKHYATDVA